MTSFHSIIRRAQRRILLDRTIRLAGWGIGAGLFLGLLLVLADRLFQLEIASRMFFYPAAAGLAAGAIVAWFTQPSATSTAILLDRALRLKDRMGTARALSEVRLAIHHDTQFAALVEQEAQRIAGGVDFRYATPIRITGIWAATLVLAAALWIGSTFIPQMQWAEQSMPARQDVQTAQILQQQSQELSQTIEQVVQDLPANQIDPQTAEELAALDRLAEQLSNPEASDEQIESIRDESAARLDEVATRLAEQAERDQAAAEQLVERFQGLESKDGPKPALSADEFREALKRGEFGEAARELDELLDDSSKLTPAERKATAEELRQLAEQIEQLATEQPPAADMQREAIEQALRDQGLDEKTIEDLMENPPSAEELERELQQNNIDPEVARELAQDVQEIEEQQRIEEQAQRDGADVADSLDRAAEELENPTPPPQSDPQTNPQPPAPQTQPSATQPRTEDRPQTRPQDQPQPNNQSTPPQQDQTDSVRKPSEQSPSQQRDQTEQSSSESAQQEQSQAQPSQQQQQQQGTAESPQQNHRDTQNQQPPQQPSATQPGEQQQPSTQPSNQPQQSQTQTQREPRSAEQQAQEPSDARDQSNPQQQQQQGERQAVPKPQPQPQPQPNGKQQQQGTENQQQTPSPSDTLRKLAERRKGETQKQHAQRLRELAREMSDNMTPQQREQWAKQWQRQNQPQDQKQSPGGGEWPADDQQRMAGGSRADDGEAPPDRQQPPKPIAQSQTEDLDIRGDEPANQLITQWLTGEKIDPNSNAPATADSTQRLRQAQEVAERAVNESAVQKRYHKMIKRYFNRLPETIERAGAAQPPSPAPPAPTKP